MKTKTIAAAIAALSIASASFAEAGSGHRKGHANPETVVAHMLVHHDADLDGRLDTAELARSIEAMYDRRDDAIRNHRDAMVARGIISEDEAANGVVTLSFLPEDGAAILMSRADANRDNALEAEELLESRAAWRELNLSPRPYFGRES